MSKMTTCLWFDSNAEEAVDFYLSVFKDSQKGRVSYFLDVGQEIHGQPAGNVLTIEFTLNGQNFMALNGGAKFKFNESISFVVPCKDQVEIDYYWEALRAGGDPAAQECGWLKDKYGVSWQIVPPIVLDMITDKNQAKAKAAFAALMAMKKIDVAALKKAYDGA